MQIFKNSPKWTFFGIFNQLLSTQNVNVARFARNVEWDFFCDFQTPCPVVFNDPVTFMVYNHNLHKREAKAEAEADPQVFYNNFGWPVRTPGGPPTYTAPAPAPSVPEATLAHLSERYG